MINLVNKAEREKGRGYVASVVFISAYKSAKQVFGVLFTLPLNCFLYSFREIKYPTAAFLLRFMYTFN